MHACAHPVAVCTIVLTSRLLHGPAYVCVFPRTALMDPLMQVAGMVTVELLFVPNNGPVQDVVVKRRVLSAEAANHILAIIDAMPGHSTV